MPPLRVLALAALAALATGCASSGGRGRPEPAIPASIWAGSDSSASASDAPATDALAPAGLAYLRARQLIVPVAGVKAERIPDTFSAGRSGGRSHNAVDILAPRGTPVLSVDDGRIVRLKDNALGGITIYALDPLDRVVYYYAHLDRYHAGLAEGRRVARGDTVGYVGTTGNAPKDVPHLHFQVMVMPPDRRYWAGVPIDPRPVWIAGARSAAAAPPPPARAAAPGGAR